MVLGTFALAEPELPVHAGGDLPDERAEHDLQSGQVLLAPRTVTGLALELVATALIGLGTFFAIIAGGVLAGLVSEALADTEVWKAGIVVVALAVVGPALQPRHTAQSPAANPGKRIPINFLADLGGYLKVIRGNRVLALAIAGSVYFWLIAALFDPTLIVYGQDILGLDDAKNSLLRAFLAIGIGAGSALAGFLSGRKIEYGLVPLGAMGLAIGASLLALQGSPSLPRACCFRWSGSRGASSSSRSMR